eukprot:m.140424 g.140424  ORF g.140424 m.140424 type:complete len:604 (+) comp30112_c0_seq2:185-1996(+)
MMRLTLTFTSVHRQVTSSRTASIVRHLWGSETKSRPYFASSQPTLRQFQPNNKKLVLHQNCTHRKLGSSQGFPPSVRYQTTSATAINGLQVLSCPGCGSHLQSIDDTKLGFIPADKWEIARAQGEEGTWSQIDQFESNRLKTKSKRKRNSPLSHVPIEFDDGTAAALGLEPMPDNDDAKTSSSSPSPSSSSDAVQNIDSETWVTCYRCHDLKFHRGIKSTSIIAPATTHQIVPNDGSVVVCIADIFDISGTLNHLLLDHIHPRAPVILVLNKLDLLPCDAKRSLPRMMEWFAQQPQFAMFKNIKSVHFVSATNGWGLPKLMKQLNQTCRKLGVDAAFVGMTNVGKSSLINKMMQRDSSHQAVNSLKVTTSAIPGTTIENLEFELVKPTKTRKTLKQPSHKKNLNFDKKADAMYLRRCQPSTGSTVDSKANVVIKDTPGIMNTAHISALLNAAEHHAIMPRKPTKPQVFTLFAGQTLLFGALARVDFVEGTSEVVLSVFSSSQLKIHRTNPDRVDGLLNSDEQLLLTPPFEKCLLERDDIGYTTHTVVGKGWRRENACVDLVLPGIGWASVSLRGGKEATLRTYSPKGTMEAVTRSPLPFYWKD